MITIQHHLDFDDRYKSKIAGVKQAVSEIALLNYDEPIASYVVFSTESALAIHDTIHSRALLTHKDALLVMDHDRHEYVITDCSLRAEGLRQIAAASGYREVSSFYSLLCFLPNPSPAPALGSNGGGNALVGLPKLPPRRY